jgi:hypothetical protein
MPARRGGCYARGVMRFAFLSIALAAGVAGCSGKTPDGSSDGGGLSSGCSVVSSLSCGGNYVAVQCLDGISPEEPDSGVTCSGGAEAGTDTDYCCISSVPPGLGCSADATVSCSGSGETGYSCISGAFPTGGSTSFSCSVASGNPGGSSTQYCCTG